MPFTAGSPELAKAQKLASILAAVHQTGVSLAGYTGAVFVERQAKKLGFGITGITTAAAFPLFGQAGTTTNVAGVLGAGNGPLTAVLQNPSGLTRGIGGVTFGPLAGTTVGIYLKKFVRDGSDGATAQAGTTFESFARNTFVNAGFTAAVFFGGAAGSTGTVS
jgi:hypothetical protein